MPVDTPLTSRVPLARMLICTVMAILVAEPKGPLRVSVSVPLYSPTTHSDVTRSNLDSTGS